MPYIAAAVILLILFIVLGRILKIGCTIVGSLFYLFLLIVAAAILFSFLKQLGVIEGATIIPR